MKKSTKRKVAVGVGAGLALAAAAATGAYFLGGKRGAGRRKKLKAWALTARKEAVKAIRMLKKVDRAAYYNVIAKVAKRYKRMAGVNPKEVEALAKDLKRHWAKIKQDLARAKQGRKKRT